MDTQIHLHLDRPIARINPLIYGHFAEHLGTLIYDGLWVGPDSPIPNRNGIRTDVVEALKRVKLPVLRWPGGCFADDYHWWDGIGPREKRPRRGNVHWDGEETNAFGTHEFLDLCAQLGCEAYVCGNVGSGTVQELRDWVEYLNGEKDTAITRLRAKNGSPDPLGVYYFGVGNENWGCGGNMSPGFYAEEFKRYATFATAAAGGTLFKIACGANSADYGWTREFFATVSGNGDPARDRLHLANGFAIHYYCGTAGTATEYTADEWYQLLAQALRMEPILLEHRRIMDEFDPARKSWLIVDEWGAWHRPLPGTNPRWLMQQNTIRDALVAALTLDIFNRHADIVYMTNIAQVINVLQSLVLTDGPRMLCTPTYHVYDLYSAHQGGQSLALQVVTDNVPFALPPKVVPTPPLPPIPRVSGSCSQKGNLVTVSLVNAHASQSATAQLVWHGTDLQNLELKSWQVLNAPDIHAHNTFERSQEVVPRNQTCVGTEGVTAPISLAPASVNVLQFEIAG